MTSSLYFLFIKGRGSHIKWLIFFGHTMSIWCWIASSSNTIALVPLLLLLLLLMIPISIYTSRRDIGSSCQTQLQLVWCWMSIVMNAFGCCYYIASSPQFNRTTAHIDLACVGKFSNKCYAHNTEAHQTAPMINWRERGFIMRFPTCATEVMSTFEKRKSDKLGRSLEEEAIWMRLQHALGVCAQ